MPDPAVLVEITTEVVSAYLTQNHVPSAEIPALIASVHATFATIGEPPEPVARSHRLAPAVPVRQSVADEYLVSLEDGKRYVALKRHLTKLGMTPADYRAKWGLPQDYPIVAPAYGRQRSAVAKEMGLGQKVRRR